jgi:VanZ family protein
LPILRRLGLPLLVPTCTCPVANRGALHTAADGLPAKTKVRTRAFDLATKLAFIIGVIAIVMLSLLPVKQAPAVFPDKREHLAAYALLGLVAGLAFPTQRAAILLIVGLSLLAATLEIGQSFAPDRSPDVADAMFSALGAFVALLPSRLLREGPNKIGQARSRRPAAHPCREFYSIH